MTVKDYTLNVTGNMDGMLEAIDALALVISRRPEVREKLHAEFPKGEGMYRITDVSPSKGEITFNVQPSDKLIEFIIAELEQTE